VRERRISREGRLNLLKKVFRCAGLLSKREVEVRRSQSYAQIRAEPSWIRFIVHSVGIHKRGGGGGGGWGGGGGVCGSGQKNRELHRGANGIKNPPWADRESDAMFRQCIH